MYRRPLGHPLPHERDLGLLRVGHRPRRQLRVGLVGEQPVLVPVVHAVLDQDERLACRAGPVGLADGVRRRGAPGVLLAVDDGQARIAYAEAAVLVYGLEIRGLGNVEGGAAGEGRVVEVDQPRYQREPVCWYP